MTRNEVKQATGDAIAARETLKRDLLYRGQVARGFNMQPQERTFREQPNLFTGRVSAIVEPRTEPPCDHVGTGRDVERDFWGESITRCAACGGRIS